MTMAGVERRRRRMRPFASGKTSIVPTDGTDQPDEAAEQQPHRPSPQDLADRNAPFALTASVHDPEDPPGTGATRAGRPDHRAASAERAAQAERATPAERATASDPHAPRPDRAPQPDNVEGGEVDREDSPAERGLRGLVGGGSSQVSVAAALRARDAARPTAADLAAAEANLPIVRRGWVPRDDLPRR